MDYIMKIQKTDKVFDAMLMIVDRLTKSAHFQAIHESSSAENLVEIYV